jgi:signal peptidase II
MAVVVLGLDQATKTWSLNRLSDGKSIDLPAGVRLSLHRNFGVAFSRFTGFGAIIIPVVMVTVLIGWTAWTELRRPAASRWTPLAYGLVLGGAFGNLTDRLFRGERIGRGGVVDMIDLGWWPVFNLADAALSVGVVLVILTLLRSPTKFTQPTPAQPTPPQPTPPQPTAAPAKDEQP